MKGPILKEAVISWLTGRYRRNVIAFVTARQCDGGLGALYILLR
jgi:DNA-nicking Smr family endonuclease